MLCSLSVLAAAGFCGAGSRNLTPAELKLKLTFGDRRLWGF
ncbi:hypothetical protein P3T19_007278 [Paraburkholderia sp. GAS205]